MKRLLEELRPVLRMAGYLWSAAHTLIGLLLLATVYWPKEVRWRHGALHVVVKRKLIPEGMDRTGDGDCDDPGDFITGGQTHGMIVFYRDCMQWDRKRLVAHELTHVFQGMLLGPFYLLGYPLCSLVLLLWPGKSPYQDNPFEVWARKQEGIGIPWLLRQSSS